VVEIFTVQALPRDLQANAIEKVADQVAPGGTCWSSLRSRTTTPSRPRPVPRR
jgi:hypothetical protein